tara:strand:+ start:413 stop:1015 length:603 start_codon:yes stop_codon:yes gene_type:complete
MPLPDGWAAPEDFATLFQYFWHRDFPIDLISTGARRADWTIHIGIVVRNIADLMGLVTRFERGGRKDAILRSTEGDEIAVEWEWDGVEGNELDKLRSHKVWRPSNASEGFLAYAVLISYSQTPNLATVYDDVAKKWEGAKWPLLLILIDSEKTKKTSSGRTFRYLRMCLFDPAGRASVLREAPALPWRVEGSRWYQTWAR